MSINLLHMQFLPISLLTPASTWHILQGNIYQQYGFTTIQSIPVYVNDFILKCKSCWPSLIQWFVSPQHKTAHFHKNPPHCLTTCCFTETINNHKKTNIYVDYLAITKNKHLPWSSSSVCSVFSCIKSGLTLLIASKKTNGQFDFPLVLNIPSHIIWQHVWGLSDSLAFLWTCCWRQRWSNHKN